MMAIVKGEVMKLNERDNSIQFNIIQSKYRLLLWLKVVLQKRYVVSLG